MTNKIKFTEREWSALNDSTHKQTAVEWLVEQLEERGHIIPSHIEKTALKKEKTQRHYPTQYFPKKKFISFEVVLKSPLRWTGLWTSYLEIRLLGKLIYKRFMNAHPELS
jgi:hypothetical protein